VQVDLVLDGKFAASQPIEETGRQSPTTEQEFIARFNQPVAGRQFEAFLQRLLIVETAKARTWRRARLTGGRGWLRQRAYVRNGCAEDNVNVFVLDAHSRGAVRNRSV
jgi:hypothetical protein